jgi:hypothetical protein
MCCFIVKRRKKIGLEDAVLAVVTRRNGRNEEALCTDLQRQERTRI